MKLVGYSLKSKELIESPKIAANQATASHRVAASMQIRTR
jgi:hypothetical protein